ncbi:Ring finger domain/Zinc finger C3HC4 type (RING finger) containing protein [Lotmaria passim]
MSSPPVSESGKGASAAEQTGSASTSTTAVATPASPAASAEAYENICGICFTEIHPVDNPRGRLNSCNHLFCSYCIKEWAKNTNVCPSCKARFTRIYTFHTDTQQEEVTKVRRRNYKAWELTYYDDDEDEEEWEDSALRSSDAQEQVVCDICQQSHNATRMIFCDRRQCLYAAHLDCLGLAERPLTFLCPQCTQLREREDESEITAVSEAGGDPVAAHSLVAPSAVSASAAAAVAVPNGASRAGTFAASTAAGARRATPRAVVSSASIAPIARRPDARRASAYSSRSGATRPPPQRPQSCALYGGSGSSSSSSRSSSSPAPSSSASSSSRRTAPPVSVPRARIDFSKPHIPLMSSPAVSAAQHPRHDHHGHYQQSENTATTTSGGADGVEDEYYFLSPTSHAIAATIELARTQASRAADRQTRRQRERAKAERLEAAYGVPRHNVAFLSGRKRPQSSAAEEFSEELASAEKEFMDPQLRCAMEERMVRRWAADMLPVLRRRCYIEGDTVTSEADLWNEATAQARKMVREKLDAKGASLRRRREQLVRAQANREVAALAKLARIIAQHREREQQQK